MSLSWRKRQAQASDQKSWRALGTDSALWKGIDKNAGNVKTALGGAAATTEGIVTGLAFKHVGAPGGGIYNAVTKNTIYVSDASNALIAPGVAFSKNTGDTIYDSSMNCTGSGLVFTVATFGSVNSSVGQDISGVQYAIIDGGSGYKVGNTFGVGATMPFSAASGDVVGRVTSVTSTKIEPGRN
jgi:hypothetical protein